MRGLLGGSLRAVLVAVAGGVSPRRVESQSGRGMTPTRHLNNESGGEIPRFRFSWGAVTFCYRTRMPGSGAGCQDPERAVHRWHSLAVVSQAVGRPAPPALGCAGLGWSVVGRLAALRRRPPGLPFPAARHCGCCSWPGRLSCARASARRRALPCASRRPRLYCMGGAVRGRLDLLGVSPLCGSAGPAPLAAARRLSAPNAAAHGAGPPRRIHWGPRSFLPPPRRAG